jgi:hypothetical protein
MDEPKGLHLHQTLAGSFFLSLSVAFSPRGCVVYADETAIKLFERQENSSQISIFITGAEQIKQLAWRASHITYYRDELELKWHFICMHPERCCL